MDFVDLQTEFVLLAFPNYKSYKQAKVLLESKNRDIAYGGELTRLKEIQCKHWVLSRSGSYMDYQYTLADYANPPGLGKPKPWLLTGKASLMSAVGELEKRGGFHATYCLVARRQRHSLRF
ncbi:hypothetical protein OB13_15065 [Pontibacter sp. HJ8]